MQADRLFKHMCKGYNIPSQPAMFVSQWAHHWYLCGIVTYEQYVELQNFAYALLFPAPAASDTSRSYKPAHGGYCGNW